MKGITNAEIRERFEHIETELAYIKQQKQQNPLFIILFSLSTIMAVVGVVMMIVTPNPVIQFFMIIGICFMIILVLINQWKP